MGVNTSGWIDISMRLSPGMLVWEGDPPFQARLERSGPDGSPGTCQITHLRMGSHTGTHLDAPRHVFADGDSLDSLDPRLLNGPARVIDLRGLGPGLTAEHLRSHGAAGTERLLLKTDNGRLLDEPFAPDFVHLTLEAARWLVEQTSTRLVGIDYLSIEAAGDPDLPVHRALLGAKPPIWLLETLDLRAVAPGDYELVCLPLRLQSGDGGPARAFLAPPGD